MALTSNVTDTALIFEGGGMRASYTAAVVATLLGAGIHFDYVAGISAGSSNTANYLSRAPLRARLSFVDFADDPRFGSWRTWLTGRGLFNAEYIYEQTCLAGGPLPFDFDTFMANPAQCRIGAYDMAAGQTVYWSKVDLVTRADLMKRVRASSTMPLIMPPVRIGDRTYVDGALGAGGGIPLEVAQRDGHTRFFVVLTRPRDYVKPPYKPLSAAGFRTYYRRHPAVADGILARPREYNASREKLLDLEQQGRAYLFFPDHMTVSNRTTDVAALQASFEAGLDQSRRELPHWREFLGLHG